MNWLAILLQTKGAKTGGVALGTSGMVAMLIGLVDHKDKSIREMVELKNLVIMTKIEDVEKRLGDKVNDNKKILIKIDDRLYELNKRTERK